MEKIQILHNIYIKSYAVYLADHKTLVMADLHVGYEEELNKRGILVPRLQYRDYLSTLKNMFKGLEIDTIVINGDLKHEFGRISDTEWRYTLRLLDFFSEHCARIILVKGNHDTILGPIADKIGVEVVEKVVIGDVLIAHGDRIITIKAKTIIIGHEHPAISIRDHNRTETFKCFLVGKWKRKNLVVLPSMNPLIEGTDVLKEDLLSPYLRGADLKNFRVFIVADEVYDFGMVEDLLR